MAIEHAGLPISAVQFHPESVMTAQDEIGMPSSALFCRPSNVRSKAAASRQKSLSTASRRISTG